MPNGYVIYDGASLLNGERIIAIALTSKSRNSKTGAMMQTYIITPHDPRDASKYGLDEANCGNCIHRGIPTNDPNRKSNAIKEWGVRTNIWRIKNSGGFGQSSKASYKHPATMPEELARGHIKTWSSVNDIVLDPFMGAGTTAQVSMEENRRYIGFEIDKTYHKMCVDRMLPFKDNLLTRLLIEDLDHC